ncbi:hypothetical protein L1987_77277 [Smallanthus sonchifolius]|uniref:Uncharacterized protein n=1 Tax=Smallanthus sonchifolius TaxID=185202 RepID=A0ACB8Z9Q8_9ASTR|nr:hypothetical protein L1987_77277 [Smallanthus sonchifolius]
MYTIIGDDIMRKSDTTSNIRNALLYERICCVSSIHPNPKLFGGAAADAIAKFLKSDIHNLKYLGIDALGRLIMISPEIAEQHQLAVIDCLEVNILLPISVESYVMLQKHIQVMILFRLRLDGVQKKWGRPTYSSGATSSTMDSDSHITVSGIARQPEVEVSLEKQKLAVRNQTICWWWCGSGSA